MSQSFNIIGAGAAGLLAGAMLRDECATITEAAPSLPHNHSALLRFRSSIVGDALGIPFRRVSVIKAVAGAYLSNPICDALAYSVKTTGWATARSILSARGEIEERYIAPPDFIERMARKVTAVMLFNSPWDFGQERASHHLPLISTIPMPALAAALRYEGLPEFPAVHGITLRATLRDVDAHATLYFPHDNVPFYRASITGDRLILEYAMPGHSPAVVDYAIEKISAGSRDIYEDIRLAFAAFGLDAIHQEYDNVELKAQRYMKILPIENDARERFILWASENHNVYSLGRFATWRPGLLLDDIVNDVRVIQRIAAGTSYAKRKG